MRKACLNKTKQGFCQLAEEPQGGRQNFFFPSLESPHQENHLPCPLFRHAFNDGGMKGVAFPKDLKSLFRVLINISPFLITRITAR